MIFISTQPDEDYFDWQLRVQIANLKSVGFKGEYHVLLKIMRDLPNPNFIKLQEDLEDENYKFFFYYDTRPYWAEYIASLKPYLLYKHFSEHTLPEIFLIDADVVFKELPDFDILPNHHWASDTVGYIGGEYIKSKSIELLKGMCDIVGISHEVVLLRNKHSGGAQYIIRGVDAEFWKKVESDAMKIYRYGYPYSDKVKQGGLQIWTAEMWATLWNLWLTDKECKVHKELDFCWPTDYIDRWNECKILHNAGVTPERNELFYKAQYLRGSPIGKDLSYVSNKYCSIKYAQIIQSL